MGTFSLFVRVNVDFPENFSVGLLYSPNDGRPEIPLLRCNGKHGEFNAGKNRSRSNHPHWNYHIHRASETTLAAGESAEKYASVTDKFASLDDAVWYFLKEINLDSKDLSAHFSSEGERELEFDAKPDGSA